MRALDHIVFNARDRMDEVAALFERLGFFVTARGHHSLGSINHTVVFESDYLELLGYPPGAPPERRPELVSRPLGLMATVLRSIDADGTHAELMRAGLVPRPVQTFSRPVEMTGGAIADASFRVTRLEPDAVPGSWFYFCQHLTPGLVWRREWQRHANGACAMAVLDIGLPDVESAAPLYQACTASAATRVNDALVFQLDAAQLRLATAAAGAGAGMTGLSFYVPSLERLRSRFLRDGIRFAWHGAAMDIDPEETFGCRLQFVLQRDQALVQSTQSSCTFTAPGH